MTAPLVDVRDLRIGAVTDAGRKVEIIKGVSFDIAAGRDRRADRRDPARARPPSR